MNKEAIALTGLQYHTKKGIVTFKQLSMNLCDNLYWTEGQWDGFLCQYFWFPSSASWSRNAVVGVEDAL